MMLLAAPSPALADGSTAVPQIVLQETQDGQPVFDPTAGPGNDTGPNNAVVRTSDLVTYSVTMSINDPTAPTQTTFQNTKATFAPLALGFKWDSLPLDCSGPGSAITGDGVSTPSVLVCNFGAKTSGTTWNFKPAIKVLRTAASGTPLAPSATLSADALVKTAVAAAPDVIVSVSQAPKAGVTIAAPAPAAVTTLNGGRAQEYIYPVGIHVDAGSDVINGNSFSFTADLSGLPAGTALKDCEPEGGSSLPSSTPAAGGGQVRGVPGGSGTWTCTPDPANPKLIHITAKGVNTDPTVCPDHGADGTLLVSGMCYVATQWLRLIVPDSGLSAGGSQNTMWVSNLSAVDTLGNPNYGGANDPGTGKTNNDVASTPYLAGKQHGWTSNFPGPPGPGNGLPLQKVDTTYVDNFNGGSPTFTPGGATSDNIQRTSTGINSGPGGNGYVSQTGRYAGLTMVSFPGIVDVPAGFTQCMTIDNKNSTIIPLNGGTPTHGALLYTQASLLSAGWVVEYGTGGNGGVNSGDGTGWASTAAQQAGSCNTSDSQTWETDITKVQGGPGAITKIRARTTAPITIAQQLAAPCSGNCRAELDVTLQVRASTPSGTLVPNYGWFTNDPSAMSGANPTGTVTSTFNAATRGGVLGDSLIVTGVRAMISKSASVQQTLAGKAVDFTLRPATDGLGSPTPFQALNLTVTDTLPKGETYVPGSSLCGSTACQASVTMNADGTTTLVWSLGSPVAGTPVAPITYKATIGALVSDGTSLVNTAVISADNDGSPAQYRTATATVSVVNSASFAVEKSLVNPLTEPNTPKVFNLKFSNLSNNTYSGTDFIDWLPFNGDGRTPATSFHGTLTLAGPAVDAAGAQSVTFKYTSFPTASLNMSNDADPATANPAILWCDPAQFGTPGCPANYAAATGIRINGGQITAQQSDTVQITLNAAGDQKGDIFSNQSTGEVAGLGLPIQSNTATGATVLASIAGTVWDDTAKIDGLHAGSGEPGINGATVQLLDSTGKTVATTTTDSTGHYAFTDLIHGDYKIHVVRPAGYYTTAPLQGSDPAVNSKINYGTDSTGTITLAVGQNDTVEHAGLFKAAPAISLEKDLNGHHVPDPAAPLLVGTGSTMNVTFKVTNTGNTALNPVTVTDDTVKAINCPATTLAAGTSMTCTAASRVAPGPGALVPNNQPMTITFAVTNHGNVPLTGVTVTDNVIPAAGISCPQTALAIGETITCTASFPAPAPDVQHTDTATAKGTPPVLPDGTVEAPVTGTSTAFAFTAAHPAVTVVKTINGDTASHTAPGIGAVAGSDLQVSFLVTNTGDVRLEPVTVADNVITSVITCPVTGLDPGASTTCTATTKAPGPGGNHHDTATVTGTAATPAGQPLIDLATGKPVGTVTASSDAFALALTPGVGIVKKINGVIATDKDHTVLVPAGSSMAITFEVTNIGQTGLGPVAVSDDTITGTINCPATTLAAGASMTCTASWPAPAVGGTHHDTATVTGQPLGPDGKTAQGTPVSAKAEAFAHTPAPAIAVTKKINGQAAQTSNTSVKVPAGTPMNVTFDVTNTGDVRLDPVIVTDDVVPSTGIICPQTALDPGASMTCTATTAPPAPGGTHVDHAAAKGTPPAFPDGTKEADVTSTDLAYAYVDGHPGISVVKTINNDAASHSTPGALVPNNQAMPITFTVKNDGDVPLSSVTVTDSVITGAGISCPQTTLAVGESITCTASFPAPAPDVQHTDTGTATATPQAPGGGPLTDPVSGVTAGNVTATAQAFAFTAAHPAVTVVKTINGDTASHTAPGVGVVASSSMQVSFVVTNTGDVRLEPVTLSDSVPATTAISCPVTGLNPGESTTCTATTPGPATGATHQDTATATGTAATPAGAALVDLATGKPVGTVTGTSDAFAHPLTPGIGLVKEINGVIAGDKDHAVLVPAGSALAITFEVTNTGQTDLNGITLADDVATGVSCPATTLATGASMTCTASATAPAAGGYHHDTATVTGQPLGPDGTTPQGGTITTKAR
ncbi:SdrD B-like domain-containing protein, partial [Arthrobacter sp. 2RAF22]|uniref:DUF7507 domain-containing protein n=1 Tax=Arthrobacter sp. 2RAF22 TaxID=3232996 RepID=UPI003F917449